MKIRFVSGTWTRFDQLSRGEQDRVRLCVLTDVCARLATGLSQEDMLFQEFKTQGFFRTDAEIRYWIKYKPLTWKPNPLQEDSFGIHLEGFTMFGP